MSARSIVALALCWLMMGQVQAAVSSKGLYWVEGATQAYIESITLTEPVQVRLAYSQLPIGGGPVNGRAILAQGVDTLTAVELGAVGEYVELPAGEYSLLAYVDLGQEPVAELALSLQSANGNSIFNGPLSASKALLEHSADSITIQQPFTLDTASSVTFRYTGFEQFETGTLFTDTAFPLVLIRDADGNIAAPLVLNSHDAVQSVMLTAGNYTLAVVASQPDTGATGFFWQLQAGDQHFADKVNLKATDTEYPADVIDLGTTADLQAAEYVLESVWLLGANEAPYAVALAQSGDWQTLNPDNQYRQPLPLSGVYQVYLSHPGGEDAGVGIKIRQVSDGMTRYVKVHTLGEVSLIAEFQASAADRVAIQTDDLEFVNAAASVRYAVTDGAWAESVQEVYGDSQVEFHAPEAGSYFLLGQATAANNGNALLRSRIVSGATILGEGYLSTGEGLLLIQNLNLDSGAYRIALADHNFPGAATAVAIGLYGDDYQYRQYYPTGLNGLARSGELVLEQGAYQLVYQVLTDNDESALLGFEVESMEERTGSGQSDRNANGSGKGGGNGGAFGLLLSLVISRRVLPTRSSYRAGNRG